MFDSIVMWGIALLSMTTIILIALSTIRDARRITRKQKERKERIRKRRDRVLDGAIKDEEMNRLIRKQNERTALREGMTSSHGVKTFSYGSRSSGSSHSSANVDTHSGGGSSSSCSSSSSSSGCD